MKTDKEKLETFVINRIFDSVFNCSKKKLKKKFKEKKLKYINQKELDLLTADTEAGRKKIADLYFEGLEAFLIKEGVLEQ